MTLSSFKQITADEMNAEDMKNLADVVLLDSELDEGFVRNKLLLEQMIPWRLETDRGNAILVVEVKQKRKEKVLYVWYISGKGLIGAGRYILDTLEALAKLNDCTAIEAFTNPRYGRWISRPEGGFKIKHVFVRKEL